MAAPQGTKLFKIASQINIGKDAIVEFLQTKGFAVENKPTAGLTDEMVNLVLEKFQKELRSVEKQREKLERHRHDHRTQDVVRVEPVNQVDQPEAVSSTQSEITAEGQSPNEIEAQSPELQVEAPQEAVEPVAEPDNSNANDSTAVESQSIIGETPQEIDNSTAESDSKDQTSNVAANDDSDSAQAQGADSHQAEQEIIAENTDDNRSIASDKKDENTELASESIVEENSVKAPDALEANSIEEEPLAHDDGENSNENDHDDGTDSRESDSAAQSGGKRKRKRIVQVEYEAGVPPQLRGLTVLGKIDLDAAKKKQQQEQEERNRQHRQRAGNRKNDNKRNFGQQHSNAPRSRDNTQQQHGVRSGEDGNIHARPAQFNPFERIRTTEDKSAPQSERQQTGSISIDESLKSKHKLGKRGVMTTPLAQKLASPTAVAADKDKKKQKKVKKSLREMITEAEIERAIRETKQGMDEISTVGARSKMRQKRKAEREEKEQRRLEEQQTQDTVLKLTEFVTTSDLAAMLHISTSEAIMKCMKLGLMVTINQRLDKDTLLLIADDYGFTVEFIDEQSSFTIEEEEEDVELMSPRPPIVTIMGHVDHGKTSLLDFIRNANVVAGEAGGITQHIGAYHLTLPSGKKIAFLDTPGHEAFTAMRARGAKVTDIVVLVVAADDQVMPQTIEAISHAHAANVPIVVAINKVDRVESNPDRIKQQLADHGVLAEDWGGKYQCALVSAKTGHNVDVLLEKILLEAELLELKANPDRLSRGTVIEAHLDKGKGVLSTIMVQKGTLKVGDAFVVGIHSGRVRAMYDERGNRVEIAGPSNPVQISGFDGLPQAGDIFVAMESETEARDIANKRHQLAREQQYRHVRHMTLDDISAKIKEGGAKELRLIIKADVGGSLEALSDSLLKLSREEVRVNIILKGVGAISESDVMLASASEAVIIGFNTSVSGPARKSAENESVDVRLYNIIYDCINEIQLALEGLLTPEIKEEVLSTVEIRQVFKISKVGAVAGCYVLNGKITRNDKMRILRDGFPIFKGNIGSLKRIKDDVREVDQGYECGIVVNGFNDFEVGDIIESYKMIEIKRKLS